MNKSELDIITDYIKNNHVISFCCYTEHDIWAANSFYIFDQENVCFYFMTDPGTRHGKLALANPIAAGTINGQPSNIQSIKGRFSLYVLVNIFIPPDNHDFASSRRCSFILNQAK